MRCWRVGSPPSQADDRHTDNGCLMRRVYLDYNATAPLLPEALEAAIPYYTSVWGNASSIHRQGREARMAVEDARAHVARLIGAPNPLDLVFTSGGTEAVHLAIHGYAHGNRARGHHIITTGVEHPAVLDTCRALERCGFELTYLPVDGLGRVHPDVLAHSIRPHTILFTMTYGNHEVGTLQPVAPLVDVAHAHGVTVHVDAVQAVGRVPIDVMASGIDLLSLAGQKFGGPKGVGALYIRESLGATMRAVVHGGHQERERRAGTEDVPSIVGLGKACALMCQRLMDEDKRLTTLRDRLESGVLSRIPAARALGKDDERLPNTANLG